MTELLRHPATVHIPLAIAVLFPFAYLVTVYVVKVNWFSKQLWYGLLAMSVIQILSTLLAYKTGNQASAFAVGDSELLARHADLARWFLFMWIVMVGVIILLTRSSSALRWRVSNFILITLIVAQLFVAIQLGKVGGALAMH
jgi:hypothetical protein